MLFRKQCSTSSFLSTGTTLIAFVENQLSLCLISLSPLPTRHPRSIQRTPVRSSMSCDWHFNLRMGRSLSFGSSIRGLLFGSFSLSFASLLWLCALLAFTLVFTTLSPLSKLVDPLYHKYVVASFFLLLLLFVYCPVSYFPSRYFSLSITCLLFA